MKDDLRDIDQRGAAAGRDLTSRAASRPVPSFDASASHGLPGVAPLDARSSQNRRRWIAGAAAAAVLFAAGIGAVVRSNATRESDPAGVTSTLPRPFQATVLPDGFDLGGAGEVLPGDEPNAGPALEAMVTYGPALTDQQLGVFVLPEWTAEDATAIAAPSTVPVGDRTGYAYEGVGIGRFALLVPEGDGGRALGLSSPTLSVDELAEIASGMEVPAPGAPVAVAEERLPQGWTRQSIEPAGPSAAQPLALARGAGSTARYALYLGSSPDGPSEAGSILVSSIPGDEGRMYAATVLADEHRPVVVRGRSGLLTQTTWDMETNPRETSMLTWLEGPGELIRLHGEGVTTDELLAVAEGLEPVSPSDWDEVLTATALGELGTDGAASEPLGTGELSDGTAWSLRYDLEYQSLDLSVDVRSSSGSSSSSSSGSGSAAGSSDEPLQSSVLQETGGRRFIAGIVGPGVVSIQGRDAAGQPVGPPVAVQQGDDVRFFVAELPAAAADFVAVGAGGETLRTYPVRVDGGIDPDFGVTEETTPGG